ncbi:MAG: alkaline phosphatase D family protein [Bacteroidia bacterium]
MRLLIIFSSFFSFTLGIAQKKETKPEPQPMVMLGYVDYREANVWIMHDNSIETMMYWNEATPDKKIKVGATIKKVNTHYISDFKFGPLEPGITYNYKISGFLGLNDKNTVVYSFVTPSLWRWRKPAPDFSLALGSCNYVNQPEYDRPGKPYGDTATDIYNKIAEKKPNLMLWTGDNIYLREPDWGSETGIYERYIHLRQQENMRKLLTTCPNLAIWDDHDFGPNDANGSFYNKDITLKAFNDFWANPEGGISDSKGITYAFDYNDAHFLMLDNRYNRTPELCDSCQEETILGHAQLDWLKMSLLSLPKSEFKIIGIGGQFVNSVKAFENFSNWEWERNDIIQFIYKHDIKNVVFISGDRHFSELSALRKTGKPTIYDFTVSPLTSGAYNNVSEKNSHRVEGTLYSADRNFGIIQFVGKDKDRIIRFILYDKNGNEIYQKQFVRE